MASRLWPAPLLALAACAEAALPDAGSPGAAGGAPAESPEPPGDSAEQRRQRERLVSGSVVLAGVKDRAVLAAMRQVPRHVFVPRALWVEAYDDRPLPIGHEQTISQPSLVATMTELLAVGRDSRVLEIGTGSGYQAAILGEIVREVFTIEIVRPLGEEAAVRLAQLGYRNIRVRVGDGYQGWPEQAPFDAIIVTCAPEHVPPPLVEQLKTGGRLCIPVGPRGATQELRLMVKRVDGTLEQRAVLPVRFVPMTGEAKPAR